MSLRILRAAVAGLGLAAAFAVHAHNDNVTPPSQGDWFDCEHQPPDALTALPAPLDAWARIDCSPAGQKLVAAIGWQWRYPASWVTRPEAPAWSPDASLKHPGEKHFVDIDVTELDAAAVDAAHARLMRDSPIYQFHVEARPRGMYRVDLKNNLGHTFELFVPVVSDERMWAILCVPACRPEYAFLIERAPR